MTSRAFLTTFIILLLTALVVLPCIFFGTLGVTGGLADTSRAENVRAGLMFYGFAIAAALPAIVGLRRLHRSSPRHLCRKCGYDLRGNPDGTICPECGTSIRS